MMDFKISKGKITLLVILGVLMGAAWGLKDYVIPTTWRYKITVEIETPEGIKTGSAVREVRAKKNIARFVNPDLGYLQHEVTGEAVMVDLGKRGVLFGLINWDSYEEVETAFPLDSFDPDKRLRYYGDLKSGMKAELSINQPLIVFFDNLQKPSSARVAYKNKLYANGHVQIDNFDQIFDGNINLKQVSVEVTDDPMTWDIQAKVPFLVSYNKFFAWQRTLKYGDPIRMDRGNFIKKKNNE